MNQRYYSNIYWHFVGSPPGIDWHRVRKPSDILVQGGRPKSAEEGAAIAERILDSQTLRARCTERIAEGIITRPFCCVTDIPLKDLADHSTYYGTVAIGFHPAAIHASFLPVLYYPSQQLPTIDGELAGAPVKRWLTGAADRLAPTQVADPSLKGHRLTDYLKITEFSAVAEESFYREREWRHAGADFSFDESDVAAVVAPERQLEMVRSWMQRTGRYRRVPNLLSWEFVQSV